MLDRTFCHIPGIGPKTERHLWSRGVESWDAVLDSGTSPLSSKRTALLKASLRESAARLDAGDARYFTERLGTDQHWRLFPHFRQAAAYVDIETTGLGGFGDYITTIVLYDGRALKHYVHNDNMFEFKDNIEAYGLIVTYNGKTFDVPFIRNCLGIRMDHPHIDLRYVLASLGYRGGLKGCERQLGIGRGDLEDVDGFFAVLLWNDFHRNGNAKALETLLAYNTLDVVNLEELMVRAYNLKVRETPFHQACRLPGPEPPENPFNADAETIERIKAARGGWP